MGISCFLLVSDNVKKSSNGAGCSGIVLATMGHQQAVAKHFVGRRVTLFDVPFF
jgi:hypothetical protein